MTEKNKDITQFKDILFASPLIRDILSSLDDFENLNYYIGAGCIAQTIWNYNFGKTYDYGIKDIDFVYYDKRNLTAEAEKLMSIQVANALRFTEKEIDCKNQARVHLWYEAKFGVKLDQYKSLEAAIDTWPTTASAIGIRQIGDKFEFYAPYGLDDLLSGVVRANKLLITESVFIDKSTKWKGKWEELTVIPW